MQHGAPLGSARRSRMFWNVPECSGTFSLSPEADDRDELVDQLGDGRVVEDVAQHLGKGKHAGHVTLRAHDTAVCGFPNLLPTVTRRVPSPVPTGHAPKRPFGAPAAAQHTRRPDQGSEGRGREPTRGLHATFISSTKLTSDSRAFFVSPDSAARKVT
jgi:hypothetical protein